MPGSTQLYNQIAEWAAASNSTGATGVGFRSDGGSSIDVSLGGNNTGSLQVSADILYANVSVDNPSNHPTPNGIQSNSFELLGFNGQNDSSGSEYDGHSVYQGGPATTTGFTGLKVNAVGSLQEYSEGKAVGSAIAFVGTYNPVASTNLSYTIDTATGDITNVSFGNSTADYSAFATPASSDSPAGTFATVDTSYLEIGGFTPDSRTPNTTYANRAWFSDVTVQTPSPSPEPTSLAGVMVVGGTLMSRRRRKE